MTRRCVCVFLQRMSVYDYGSVTTSVYARRVLECWRMVKAAGERVTVSVQCIISRLC